MCHSPSCEPVDFRDGNWEQIKLIGSAMVHNNSSLFSVVAESGMHQVAKQTSPNKYNENKQLGSKQHLKKKKNLNSLGTSVV